MHKKMIRQDYGVVQSLGWRLVRCLFKYVVKKIFIVCQEIFYLQKFHNLFN